MARTERKSDRRRREEKWQTYWCCRDQQRACRMAQTSAEKLEQTGPSEKESTNQQPPQRCGAVPNPVWVGSKWLLAFPRIPVTPSTPLQKKGRHLCFGTKLPSDPLPTHKQNKESSLCLCAVISYYKQRILLKSLCL